MSGFLLTPRAARAERARELSERFRSLLERPQPSRPAGLIGVEHEFTLRAGDRVLDFRDLIHTLPVDGIRVDPTDPNAYRCDWGGTITADGREAEIATPPVPVAAGFSGELTAWSDRGRASLGSVLPASIEVSGYSTHLNLQMPDRLNDAVCDGVIRRFVPALMLLTERADSPGVLVRPRPGRLEVGTEFVDGPSLRAAAVLLAGVSVRWRRRSAGATRCCRRPCGDACCRRPSALAGSFLATPTAPRSSSAPGIGCSAPDAIGSARVTSSRLRSSPRSPRSATTSTRTTWRPWRPCSPRRRRRTWWSGVGRARAHPVLGVAPTAGATRLRRPRRRRHLGHERLPRRPRAALGVRDGAARLAAELPDAPRGRRARPTGERLPVGSLAGPRPRRPDGRRDTRPLRPRRHSRRDPPARAPADGSRRDPGQPAGQASPRR